MIKQNEATITVSVTRQ